MGKIPMVTCRECGKEFSALRADCPFCGTRRLIGDGAGAAPRPQRAREPRTPQKQASAWQLKLGLLLVAVGILALVLMLLSGRADKNGLFVRATPVPTAAQTVEPRPTPTPSPTPTVENIKILYLNREITAEEGGFTMYVGDEPLTITARAYPNDKLSDARFTWRVSDSSKAKLTPSSDTQSCEVEVLESAGGSITLTVSCFGAEYSVPLYIWSRD